MNYYATGTICRYMFDHTKCKDCTQAFTSPSENESKQKDQEETLNHPNPVIFKIIKIIELSFARHCQFNNVFDLILNDLQMNAVFSFHCSTHASDVLAFIIKQYLQVRIRDFVKRKMSEVQKDNFAKKKVAKFCKT